MKKLLLVLVAVLLLTGCSKGGYAKVSNEDDVLYEIAGTKYTKEQLYESFHINANSFVQYQLIMMLAEAEEIDLEALKKEAEEYIQSLKDYGAYGEYLISYYGGEYSTKITYEMNAAINDLLVKYVNVKSDELDNEYNPVSMMSVYFDDLESAQKMVDMIADGQTYEYAATEAGWSSKPTASIVTCKDSIQAIVKQYGMDAKEKGVSGIIETEVSVKDNDGNSVSAPRYYIVNIVETEFENMIDDFATYLLNNEYIESDEILNYFFKLHDINFYDQSIYDLLTETYTGLK